MTARWAVRVAEAERARYGPGVAGGLLLLACERRLPQPARQAGRQLARRAGQATAVAGLALLAVLVAAIAIAVELVSAVV